MRETISNTGVRDIATDIPNSYQNQIVYYQTRIVTKLIWKVLFTFVFMAIRKVFSFFNYTWGPKSCYFGIRDGMV